MSKFVCVCGEVIRISGDIPNPIEWKLISDTELVEFGDVVATADVYLTAVMMFRCPVSDHLWIYWNGIDKAPALYERRPDSEARRGA